MMKVKKILLAPVLMLAMTTVSGCDNPLTNLFKKNKGFNVYWKNYDGSILEMDEVKFLSMPEYNGQTPHRANDDAATYTFKGWDKELLPVNKDIEYIATYESSPREYQISWLNWDNSLIATSMVAYGETPEYKGATPTRSGDLYSEYTFAGWDRALVPVKGEASYKATFIEKKYDVCYITYSFNETKHPVSNSNATAVRKDETLDLSPATAAGYDFGGWYLDADRTIPVSKIENIRDNIVIFGQFNVHTYDVIYKLEGGNEGDYGPDHITCLEEAELLSPEKTGYNFVTWKDQKGRSLSKLEDVCENLTLTANYSAKEYIITLRYAEKDDVYMPIKFDQIVHLPQESKSGYEFLGWFYENNPEEKCELEGQPYQFLNDITLIQKWSDPIVYSISYELNGGENPANAPEEYSIVNQPALPTPTREGYDFDGWYYNGVKVELLRGYFEDLSLTAQWIAKDVVISFDYDGGSLTRTINFFDGNELARTEEIAPDMAASFEPLDDKLDAQFNGWVNELGQYEFLFDKTVNSDLNLRAYWVPIRSDALGAKINEEAQFNVNDRVAIYQYTPLVSQRVTFAYAGSNNLKAELSNESGQLLGGTQNLANSFSFDCVLEANRSYFLKVSAYDGSGNEVITATSEATNLFPQGKINSEEYLIASTTQKFGELFESVGEPVKAGYHFDGWLDENDHSYDAATELSSLVINLKASWSPLE